MSEEKTKSKSDSFVLQGKAFYLNSARPNELSGKYQMDLCVDDATVERLTTLGIEVKNKGDDRGNFVTLKRSAETKDGKPMSGPRVIDSEKNEIPDDILVGNGSTVKVITNKFDWKFKGKTGVGLGLDTVQVLDLIPYENTKLNLLDE